MLAAVSESLHPTAGVRVLLERADPTPAAAGAARYLGVIFTPQARYDYTVDIAADAAVALAPIAAEPPADPRAVELLRAVARTLGRHALAESPPAWPRRVVRWRSLRPPA